MILADGLRACGDCGHRDLIKPGSVSREPVYVFLERGQKRGIGNCVKIAKSKLNECPVFGVSEVKMYKVFIYVPHVRHIPFSTYVAVAKV